MFSMSLESNIFLVLQPHNSNANIHPPRFSLLQQLLQNLYFQSPISFTLQSYIFENNTNILFSVLFLFIGIYFQTVLFLHFQSLFLKFCSFFLLFCTFTFMLCLVFLFYHFPFNCCSICFAFTGRAVDGLNNKHIVWLIKNIV